MSGGATPHARRPGRGRWSRVWGALAGLGVLGIFAGAAAFAGWKLLALPVERVVVTGDIKHVTRDELMSAISDVVSGGFLWLDLQAVRAPLEQLPWVHRAVVRRQWPGSIEVRVIEERAIASWRQGEFLNHAGQVFSPRQAPPLEGLPSLSGPEGSQGEVMLHYKQVQERLQPLGLRVAALEMNSRGGLLVTLAGGGELLLGREDLDGKLDRLERIYRQRLQARRGELARVDLRYSHGAAVAWKQQDNQKS